MFVFCLFAEIDDDDDNDEPTPTKWAKLIQRFFQCKLMGVDFKNPTITLRHLPSRPKCKIPIYQFVVCLLFPFDFLLLLIAIPMNSVCHTEVIRNMEKVVILISKLAIKSNTFYQFNHSNVHLSRKKYHNKSKLTKKAKKRNKNTNRFVVFSSSFFVCMCSYCWELCVFHIVHNIDVYH